MTRTNVARTSVSWACNWLQSSFIRSALITLSKIIKGLNFSLSTHKKSFVSSVLLLLPLLILLLFFLHFLSISRFVPTVPLLGWISAWSPWLVLPWLLLMRDFTLGERGQSSWFSTPWSFKKLLGICQRSFSVNNNNNNNWRYVGWQKGETNQLSSVTNLDNSNHNDINNMRKA